jgi:hypothetical protein
MDLPLLKNDIPNNLEPQKPVIYSRYSRLRVEDFQAKSSRFYGFNFSRLKAAIC